MDGLETQIGKFVQEKLPALSEKTKESLVKYLPWVIIVLNVLGLLAWLGTIGLFGMGMAVGMHAAPGMALSFMSMLVIYALTPVMLGLSLLGGYLMLQRKLIGWRIAFYSLLFGLIINILHISVLGLALNLLFAYLLFQIRESYR